MKSVIFLVSGNGGTLKFLNEAIKWSSQLRELLYIKAVIGDRTCGALSYAENNNIENYLIKYRRDQPSDDLKNKLEELEPDFIITNIHKILGEEIVNIFEGRLINLHYSLLPAFKGLIGVDTVKEAFKIKSKLIGATCHLVDKEVDNGEILSTCAFPVNSYNEDALKDAIEMTFRGGCLTLLNSLLSFQIDKKSDNFQNIINYINNGFFIFSPGIIYNISEINNEEFWNKIK